MLKYIYAGHRMPFSLRPALRAIVLDEVHLYGGTLAADICLLLRRVAIRAGVKGADVLHIAASATLGGSETDLKNFGAELFSKDASLIHVVYGMPHRRDLASVDPPVAPLLPESIDASPLGKGPDRQYRDSQPGGMIRRQPI